MHWAPRREMQFAYSCCRCRPTRAPARPQWSSISFPRKSCPVRLVVLENDRSELLTHSLLKDCELGVSGLPVSQSLFEKWRENETLAWEQSM